MSDYMQSADSPVATTTDSQSASDCACDYGDIGCDVGAVTGPLRPRFFAGQLLTEDDINLLQGYVVEKLRLHNRYLHGAGVVCGLQATCHPCGDGRVIVQSGYALDCCGNDILVPCPEVLDINAMVRELRLRQLGGYDCGDPCTNGKDRKSDRALRRYCLYVNYTEDLIDPVTPYVTEDCTLNTCEASRIAEGFRFSLECAKEEPTPDNVLNKIGDCFHDLLGAEKYSSAVAAGVYVGRHWKLAQQRAARDEVPKFETDDVAGIQSNIRILAEFRTEFERTETAPREARVRDTLDALHATSSALARYYLADEEVRKKHADLVKRAEEQVRGTDKAIGEYISELSSERDRIIADSVRRQSIEFIDPAATMQNRRSLRGMVFAHGGLYSYSAQNWFVNTLAGLREWLLCRLDEATHLTDCTLRDDVMNIRIPGAEEPDAEAIERAALRLARALLRYFADCFCAALLPPCQACDNKAVLVACLDVENCKVINICNLERTFVLNPISMRYWVPLLHGLGEWFESLCCELTRKLAEPLPKDEQGQIEAEIAAEPQNIEYTGKLFSTSAPPARFIQGKAVRYAVQATGLSFSTAQSIANVTGNFANIVGQTTPLRKLPRIKLGDLALAEVGGEIIDVVAGRPKVREILRDATRDAVREHVPEVVDLQAIADLQVDVEGHHKDLRNLRRQMANRPTESEIKNIEIVKAQAGRLKMLEKTLKTQTELTEKLSKRLNKLER